MIFTEVGKVMVHVISSFVTMERCIDCDEDYATHVLPVCQVFGDLQRRPWQERVAAHVECIFGGAPSENLRSDFKWLYMIIYLVNVLFCELKLFPG
jgi:hypothetical protein